MTKKKILDLFDRYVIWFIFSDISKSLEVGAKLLTALGLVTYTEFIGGLMSGNGGKRGFAESNFYKAYNQLGDAYTEFDESIMKKFRYHHGKARNFYDIVRCGLTHEFFVKKNFVIARHHPRGVGAPGVGWHEKKIVLCLSNYFEDFIKMCVRYRVELSESRELQINFSKFFDFKPYLR